MSRRSIVKKHYPLPDSLYNSFLITLLTARILKKGKKRLAHSIVLEAFLLIKEKTSKEPIKLFEKAVKNTTPLVEVKTQYVKNSSYQVPFEVSRYRGTTLALCWIIKASKDRSGRTMSLKLASEIIDASKKLGNAVKKCEETHSMAEANKAFAHFRE
jgi:small subunit ribosomal protein S7